MRESNSTIVMESFILQALDMTQTVGMVGFLLRLLFHQYH